MYVFIDDDKYICGIFIGYKDVIFVFQLYLIEIEVDEIMNENVKR